MNTNYHDQKLIPIIRFAPFSPILAVAVAEAWPACKRQPLLPTLFRIRASPNDDATMVVFHASPAGRCDACCSLFGVLLRTNSARKKKWWMSAWNKTRTTFLSACGKHFERSSFLTEEGTHTHTNSRWHIICMFFYIENKEEGGIGKRPITAGRETVWFHIGPWLYLVSCRRFLHRFASSSAVQSDTDLEFESLASGTKTLTVTQHDIILTSKVDQNHQNQ